MDRSQEKFHLQWHALQEVLDYHQFTIDENQNNEEKDLPTEDTCMLSVKIHGSDIGANANPEHE
jgi:hypothetical protein